MSDDEQEMNGQEYQEYLNNINADTIEEVSAEEFKHREDIQKEIYDAIGKQFKVAINEEMIKRCKRCIEDIVFFQGIYGERITAELLYKRMQRLVDHKNSLTGED